MIDWHDIQGNILRGYAPDAHAAYVFIQVRAPEAARRALGALIPRVATEERWESRPPARLNVALTEAGLRALEVDTEPFAPFADFRQGMRSRARSALGDLGANDPDNWEPELTAPLDVMLTLYGSDGDARNDALARLRRELERPGTGLEIVHVQCADALREDDHRRGPREHFGFRDGFSQPAVEGVSEDRRSARGEGVRLRRRLPIGERWRPLALGEFVLGHDDEDGVVPGAGKPLLHNGTFMVWRKLAQHVDEFERWVSEEVGDDPAARERLMAQIVGRWRDGTSLVSRPAGHGGAPRPSPPPDSDPRPVVNDFVYGGDPKGLHCPLGAHVRRANPRDALGFATERSRRNRIIRRGVSYADAGERGLIFVCFNASITRQFEQIQGNWLMHGDAFGLGAERDFLTAGSDRPGQRTRMTIQGDRARPPRFISRERQFVTVRGGHYLFVPGLTALRTICRVG